MSVDIEGSEQVDVELEYRLGGWWVPDNLGQVQAGHSGHRGEVDDSRPTHADPSVLVRTIEAALRASNAELNETVRALGLPEIPLS